MNSAYKHLDSKLRVAELSLGQWLTVLTGVGAGIVWVVYLSPLGTSLTLITGIYLGALPAAAALFAGISGFDVWLMVRSARAWRQLAGGFVPGPGASARGYAVHESERERERRNGTDPVEEIDLAAIWERS